jgi:hypothetical protein
VSVARADDPRQKLLGVLDPALLLPEYVIDFEYIYEGEEEAAASAVTAAISGALAQQMLQQQQQQAAPQGTGSSVSSGSTVSVSPTAAAAAGAAKPAPQLPLPGPHPHPLLSELWLRSGKQLHASVVGFLALLPHMYKGRLSGSQLLEMMRLTALQLAVWLSRTPTSAWLAALPDLSSSGNSSSSGRGAGGSVGIGAGHPISAAAATSPPAAPTSSASPSECLPQQQHHVPTAWFKRAHEGAAELLPLYPQGGTAQEDSDLRALVRPFSAFCLSLGCVMEGLGLLPSPALQQPSRSGVPQGPAPAPAAVPRLLFAGPSASTHGSGGSAALAQQPLFMLLDAEAAALLSTPPLIRPSTAHPAALHLQAPGSGGASAAAAAAPLTAGGNACALSLPAGAGGCDPQHRGSWWSGLATCMAALPTALHPLLGGDAAHPPPPGVKGPGGPPPRAR